MPPSLTRRERSVAVPPRSAMQDRDIRIGLLIAAAGWVLVAEAATPGVRYGGLILVSAGSFCALAVFWTLCGSLLSQAAGPAGMALINCVGIAGGSAVTPFVVGVLKDWSGSFSPGVLFVTATLLLTIGLATLVAAHQRATADAHRTDRPGRNPSHIHLRQR